MEEFGSASGVGLAESRSRYEAPRIGRPPLEMSVKIDATPEEVAHKIMNTPPPKDGWEYMKRRKRG